MITRAMAEAVFTTFYNGDAARVDQAMSQFGTTEQFTLAFNAGQIVQSGAVDGQSTGIGEKMTYAFPDDHTITWQEQYSGCLSTYNITWLGDNFQLKLLKSSCPADPISQIIIESSPWTLKPTEAGIPDGEYLGGLISRATADATFARLGVATSAEATTFLDGFPQHFAIRLLGGHMDVLADSGGSGLQLGATATYAFPDDHTISLQDNIGCLDTLGFTRQDSNLTFAVVSDSCGTTDMAEVSVIFESTPFTAAP